MVFPLQGFREFQRIIPYHREGAPPGGIRIQKAQKVPAPGLDFISSKWVIEGATDEIRRYRCEPRNGRSKKRTYGAAVFLKELMGLAGLSAAGTLWIPMEAAAGKGLPEIRQPLKSGPDHFMARAAEMRRKAVESGDLAYGAIIVKDGRIVGEGPGRVIVNHDPTDHGEMEAIRDAGRRLGTNGLSGCEIYTTASPCQMCETVCYWANPSLFPSPSGRGLGEGIRMEVAAAGRWRGSSCLPDLSMATSKRIEGG